MLLKLSDLCGLLLRKIEQHWRKFIIADARYPTFLILKQSPDGQQPVRMANGLLRSGHAIRPCMLTGCSDQLR
jgi:hypothetical protein